MRPAAIRGHQRSSEVIRGHHLGGQPKFETGRSAVRQVLFLLRVESNRLGSEVVPVGKWEGVLW